MKKLIIAGIVGMMIGLAGQKLIAYCAKCYYCDGVGNKWSQCISCQGQGGKYERCMICHGSGERCY